MTVDIGSFGQMSVSDHVVSALERIPLFFLGSFIGIYFLFLSKPTAPGTSSGDQLGRRTAHLFTLAGEDYVIRQTSLKSIFFWIAVNLVQFISFSGAGMAWLGLLFLAVWPRVVIPVLSQIETLRIELPGLRPALYALPLLLGFAMAFGVSEGTFDKAVASGKHLVLLSSGEKILGASVIRWTQHGVLMWDSGKRSTLVVPWSSIKRIDERNIGTSFVEPPSCRWFNYLCESKPISLEPTWIK